MSIEELQQIRDGLCEKVELLVAPGAPFDPAIIAHNGQGYACGMCGHAHLHTTPALLKFWAYQDANLAYWELQKELRAKELQLAVAIEQAEAMYGGFGSVAD
ncbi:MAG: hypothetical protein IH616_20685 [Gemmatimonadales bacterium]|nr:hypothetical protein [Gemmatimonadales bacterium]